VKSLDKILVVMDKPKHEQIAFRRAMTLHRDANAHLDLRAFAYHPMFDQSDVFETHQRHAIKKEIMRERTEWLRGQVLDAGGVFEDLSLKTIWTKDIAGWVSAEAQKGDYDLVIKTAHRSRTATHTPLDWVLLRDCPKPVLLAVEPRWPKKMKVVAALDVNRDDAAHRRLNKKVLDTAHQIADLHDGTVHCVYAIEVSQVLSDLDIVNPRKTAKLARDRATGILAEITAPYGIPKSRIHMPLGKVGQAVNGIAKKVDADLMVMGTTARKGLKGMVIGNSAERVLAKARGDLLALKP
jgi:universal stress protein E